MSYDVPLNLSNISYCWIKAEWKSNNLDVFESRCSHTSTKIGDYIYVIAGGKYVNSDFIHYNDVWKFSIVKGSYEKVYPTIDNQNEERNDDIKFTGRRGHSACAYKDRYIYIFGGISNINDDTSNECTLNNDLFLFDTFSNKFSKPVDSLFMENYPCPRRGHISTIYNDKLIIIGGDFNISTELNKIYLLDLITFEFTFEEGKGKICFGLSLCSYERLDNCLYIFGGSNFENNLNSTKNSIFRYINLETFEWRDYTHLMNWNESSEALPVNRFCCSSALLNTDIMICFGGTEVNSLQNNSVSQNLNDVLLLSLNNNNNNINFSKSNKKKFISGRSKLINNFSNPLPCMNGMTLTSFGSTIVLIGGGVFPTNYFNDIYILNFFVLPSIERPLQDDNKKLLSMFNYFETLLSNDDIFSDILFILDSGDEVYSHRIILSSRCEYFRLLLNGSFLEGHNNDNIKSIEFDSNINENNINKMKFQKIKLIDITLQNILWIKEFLYIGKLRNGPNLNNIQEIFDLLSCANMFGIDELKDVLEELLGSIFIIHDYLDITSSLDIINDRLKTNNKLLIDDDNDDDDNNNSENDVINKLSFIFEIIQLAEFYSCFKLITKAIQYLRLVYLMKDIKCNNNSNNNNNNNNNNEIFIFNSSVKDNINKLLSNLTISDELKHKLKSLLLNYSSNIVYNYL